MAQSGAMRLLLSSVATLLTAVVSGCGSASPEPQAAPQIQRSAAVAPERTAQNGESIVVGVREHAPNTPLVANNPSISLTCDHDGAQADSQIHPTCMIVPPDAGFLIRLPSSLSPEDIEPQLRQVGGGLVSWHGIQTGDRWRLVPDAPLERGSTYEIWIQVRGAGDPPRRVTVMVPKLGVLDVIEARISGQPTPERVLIASDRVDILDRNGRLGLTLPDIETVRSAVAADFDLDGRIDLAVLGTDSRGRPVLHWLRNTSSEGRISFQARRLELPSDLMLAVDLAAVDLGRTGLVDLVVADMSGSLWPLANRVRAAIDSDGTPTPFQAQKPIDIQHKVGSLRELAVVDQNRNGIDDLVVGGSRGTAIMLGTEKGLTIGEVFQHRGSGAWLVEGGALPAMLVSRARALQRGVLTVGGGWQEQPLLDFPVVSAEAVCVGPPHADGSAEVLLAYRDQSEGIVRRFRHIEGRFLDQGGRRVGDVGRINGVRTSVIGSLLVSAETGLYELRESTPATRVIGFDSRVVFDQPVQVAVLPPMDSYVLSDIDGDGRLDVTGLSSNAGGQSLEVWLNRIHTNGGLSKTWSTQLTGGQFGSLVALDVNRNGLSDVLLLPSAGGSAGELYLSLGDGRLEHAGAGYLSSTPVDSAGPPLAVDLNGDGFADLFWPTPTGSISFSDATLPSERGGLFSADGARLAPMIHPETGESFALDGRLVVSALDGRRPDIMAAGVLGDGALAAVAVYRNELRHGRAGVDFTGRFLRGWFHEVLEIAAGEFDPGHRGFAAIVRSSHRTMLVVWPRVDSDPVVVTDLSPEAHGLQVIDVDGDGDADVAFVPNSRARSMLLFINDGTGSEFSSATVSSDSLAEARVSGGPLRRVHLVDLDGDGRPDLLGIAEDGDAWHAGANGGR
jgi:hypothetical protein